MGARTPSQGGLTQLDLAQCGTVCSGEFALQCPKDTEALRAGVLPSPSGDSDERNAGRIEGVVDRRAAAGLDRWLSTTRSWSDGCPGVYSGVRYFASQRNTLPWDGKVFFALDLPLTAVVDTLLLPASAFVDREKPQAGWVPGCRWAY